MPTENIRITANDIGFVVHETVKCGNAYIVSIENVGEPFASALVKFKDELKGKKFVLFSCCEGQDQNAKDHIEDVVKICNGMIENNEAIFIANYANQAESLRIHIDDLEKRTLH